jgi:hypothetical protein
VKVKRGIDTRLFPTMDKLREVLKGYAWKWMGPSVTQDGDPVKRHVLHISRRLPVAYLLMQPPGFGKSSLAGRLFPKAKVKLIAGDRMIDLIARGQRKAGDALRAVIAEDYSPFRMDRTIERIFAAGLAGELVEVWLRAARGRDFAVEGYVPAAFQADVEQRLRDAGCLPIRLEWQKPGLPLLPRADLEQRAEAFYLSMAEAAAGEGRQYEAAGFVDEAVLDDGQLLLRGWAVTAAGRLPRRLHVAIDGRTRVLDTFEREMRVDVQAHLGLPHALYGWRASVDAAGLAPAALATLAVAGEDEVGALTPMRYSGAQAGS